MRRGYDGASFDLDNFVSAVRSHVFVVHTILAPFLPVYPNLFLLFFRTESVATLKLVRAPNAY